MRLSQPIHKLKRRARLLSREEAIPLSAALDRIARDEGFAAWSALAARHAEGRGAGRDDEGRPVSGMLSRLADCDMLLLGARPGQGKTVLGLRLLLEAAQGGRPGVFFTLYHTDEEAARMLSSLDGRGAAGGIEVMTSDEISAAFIAWHMRDARRGTVAVIDYLQLLDQQRRKPPLAAQLATLRAFAREKGVVLVFLSQISRAYDPEAAPLPGLRDLSKPNEIDPAVFDKLCFLQGGRMRFGESAIDG